jgi:hypothetical protein
MLPKASQGAKSNKVPFQMSTRHQTYAPETPISTNQISNNSTDKDQSDEQPSTMDKMRAGILHQLREEMAQQL